MPAPRIETVNTISDFSRIAESLLTAAHSPLWFRGIGNSTYELVPTLFRHPSVSGIKELIELEFEILNRFKHRSIPFQQRTLNSDWEYLFFMQHYGVPTRLLDWSENSFVSLYFALASAEETKFASDAAVWILNPQLWNAHFLGAAWKNRILAIPDPPLDSYKPTDNLRSLNTSPVAMAGMHNSHRIVAQRGAFTIFGSNKLPIEQIYDSGGFPPDSLVKICLPRISLAGLQKSLFALGYCDSMIYPDLTGLALEIKRHFGFKV